MIPTGEIAAAKAVPMPQLVGEDLRLYRAGGGLYKAACPFHSDKTPSFVVYSDHAYCFGCQTSVDPIGWIERIKRVDFPTAVKYLVNSWNGTPAQLAHPLPEKAPRETEVPSLVSKLWRSAAAPGIARLYLESRGLTQKALPGSLRGHRRVWCSEVGDYRPAMLAAISDDLGRITALQRIYLSDALEYDGVRSFAKGARAADLVDPKKTIGPMGVGAVRLAAAGEILGLSKGIESALAAAKLFRLPVWASCGSGRLRKAQVQLPACVRHVVIFGDGDEPGRKSAAAAEVEYRRRGYGVQCEFPIGKDFAEVLR